ncbi:unnamed protein product, partial [Polarella glacialis]
PRTFKGKTNTVTKVDLYSCEAGAAAVSALLAFSEGKSPDDDDEASIDEKASEAAASDGAGASVSASAFEDPDGEPFRSICEISIPGLKLKTLELELLQDEWKLGSHLLVDFLAAQGATDVRSLAWIVDSEACASSSPSPEGGPAHACSGNKATEMKIRQVQCMMPVPPAPMCPRQTNFTATYRLFVAPDGASIVIESSCLSHDVPFGDKFMIQEQLKLEIAGDGVRLLQSGRCVFLKSCGMLQGRIKAATVFSLTKASEKMVALLNARATPEPSLAGSAAAAGQLLLDIGCTVRIYELQRRTNL